MTTTTVNCEQEKSSSSDKKLPDMFWMVKPCFQYKEEYSDCKSFKARFHQYFVAGEATDCSQWKEDHDNCNKWENNENEQALKALIESEKARVRQRLRGHYENDIWEPREEPPKDWNKELPSDIQKEYSTSFLKRKVDDIKEGKDTLGSVDKNIEDTPWFDSDEGSITSMCLIC